MLCSRIPLSFSSLFKSKEQRSEQQKHVSNITSLDRDCTPTRSCHNPLTSHSWFVLSCLDPMWNEGRSNPAGPWGGEDWRAGSGYVYSGVTCYSSIQQRTLVECRGDTQVKGNCKEPPPSPRKRILTLTAILASSTHLAFPRSWHIWLPQIEKNRI